MTLLFYPAILLKFWFLEVPLGLLKYYKALDSYFIHVLSIPLLFRTFFKPLKNEYRKGLVGFSIAMGIVVKIFLISISLLFLMGMLVIEFLFLFGFTFLPFITVYLLFIK